MSISIIIPVFNEERQIENTLRKLALLKRKITKFELIIIDDFSFDNSYAIIKKIKKKNKSIKLIKNKKKGLGSAIQLGISSSKNDYACIFMADLSDDINDIIKYYNLMKKENIDAVFGSRFIKDSKVLDYPIVKLILNRIFNNFVRLIFFSNYNDFTNAFKIYNRKALLKLFPFVSENFNIFLEIPLRFITKGYKYCIIPIKWKNRKKGKSKFKINELGSMYLYTLLYCFFERIFYQKKKMKKNFKI